MIHPIIGLSLVSRVSLIHKDGDTSLPENFRMISLTSCVSKVFHQILANWLVEYIVENKFVDKSVQKAFIYGINGCIDHNQVVQEISRYKKRTVHITFFDIADAFGSVSHDIISHSLKRFDVPQNVSLYIENLYSKLQGSIAGCNWSSNPFTCIPGGSPPACYFPRMFQPLLEYLAELNDKYGYNVYGTKVITSPYADDFKLITCNKLQHQKIISKLHQYSSSMGLILKPSKCCSLSVSSGSPREIPFYLSNETSIRTLREKPHRHFLGAQICFSGKTSEVLQYVYSEIKTKLERIDRSLVRPESKVVIYTRHMQPSVRFLLTVHSLHKTN